MDLGGHYNKLLPNQPLSESTAKIAAGNYEIDHLIDSKADNRFGITLGSENTLKNCMPFISAYLNSLSSHKFIDHNKLALMKVPFKLSILALVCLLIISSCKKEIDYHPEWDSSSMSGKVDGILLQCTIATAQTYAIGGKTTVQILGNKLTSGFSLVISDFKGVGTYTLSDSNVATYLPNNLGLQDAYLSASNGTIKITSYLTDQYIKGTFEFKGHNYVTSATKTISEGQFNISLVPAKIPESNNSTNNLNAKVDGTAIGFTGEAASINSPLGKLLTITTVNGDKRLIISIAGYNGAGTYDIAKDGTGVYMKDQSQTGSFYADAGTLVITSETGNKLKGTFFFSGGNQNTTINTTVNITDGTFDLPFSKL